MIRAQWWTGTLFIALILGNTLIGCSSIPPVKTQAYAKLSNERFFENEFPIVWKAIEETLRNFKITDRNPKDVDPLELQQISHRSLDTDWIYTQSRDKYQEYHVNGVPKKIYVQTRYKYHVLAERSLGGVKVTVRTEEEIERMKANGTSDGYVKADQMDTSRPSELLEKIRIAILAAPRP